MANLSPLKSWMTQCSNPGLSCGLHREGEAMRSGRGQTDDANPGLHLPALHPALLVATVFGVGRIPVASGTFGSLAALPFGWALATWAGSAGLVAGSLVALAAGTLAASRIVGRDGDADPGYIVVDEVAGQLLALAFAPQAWWGWLIAFAAFRVADIAKPFPAGWCDRNIGGGFGVMADDMVAGLQAGIATWIACSFTPLREALDALAR